MPESRHRDRRPVPGTRLSALRTAARRALVPASFGADPSGERLERVRNSPNFSDGAFRNPVPTRTMIPGSTLPLLRATLGRADRVLRAPARPVPVHRPGAAELSAPPASGLRLRWLGHASVLAEIDGRRVLFDPVWGERCSPFAFVGPRRLHPMPLPLDRTGPLDAVVISHDHYDHLDLPAIRGLISSGVLFAVPLGVGAHLERWGVPAAQIAELDWHETVELAGLSLTATPARHFCGRGLRNGMRTLWASWVVAGPRHRVFHSGDTGYFPGFAEIGASYGPFDATMIQIGAYSEEFWPEIHMTPEEGVRAHTDLSGGALLPVHWGTFNLAPHPWDEPAERTLAAARPAGASVATPRPGEAFEPVAVPPADPWWRAVAALPGRRGSGTAARERTASRAAANGAPADLPVAGDPVSEAG